MYQSEPSEVEPEETLIILNPASGDGKHAEQIRKRASLEGYDIRETKQAGDGVEFAEEAIERGKSVIAAAGGDGTLNEVVRGICRNEASTDVTVAVIPGGTGNNFAENVGISTIADGFDVLATGERRRIDVGMADGRPFVNSCVGGLTADSSGQTSSDLKRKLGVLAYVLTTLQTMTTYDGINLTIEAEFGPHRSTDWTGNAICVLVGNGRRFTWKGSRQANMEDGLFDVAIIEEAPAKELVGIAIIERILGEESPNTIRLRCSSLEITNLNPRPVDFSLDGEIIRESKLKLLVKQRQLQMAVGQSYESNPSPEG